MSGADFQQFQQMMQQAQTPPAQRQQQPFQMPPMQPMQPMQQAQPQYDLMQAIASLQRQPAQAVQNPIFGGAIPINFNLPQVNQVPADFQVRQFQPGAFNQAPTTYEQGFSPVNSVMAGTFGGGNQND